MDKPKRIAAIRESLRPFAPDGKGPEGVRDIHPGLALQRYLTHHDAERKAARALLDSIQQLGLPEAYPILFARWKASLGQAVFLEATALTPLAIGLGNATPLENGLALHHTYGFPYLPGSALKGLARRAALHHGLSQEEMALLFGEQKGAGHIVFWDGWPDPKSPRPLQKDVITVHHQAYYGTRGKVWPTDFDDPNPVPFLSVRPGVRFWVPLSSGSEGAGEWVFLAARLVRWGLENLGLGGKTNAGYGYFEVKLPPKPKSAAELGKELYERYRFRIEQIKPRNERSELDFFITEFQNKPLEERRPVLEAIKAHLVKWKVWNPRRNPQHARIEALLEEG